MGLHKIQPSWAGQIKQRQRCVVFALPAERKPPALPPLHVTLPSLLLDMLLDILVPSFLDRRAVGELRTGGNKGEECEAR